MHCLQCQAHSEFICIKASSVIFGEGTSEDNSAIIGSTFFPTDPKSLFYIHVSAFYQTFFPPLFFTKKTKPHTYTEPYSMKSLQFIDLTSSRGCKQTARSPLTAREIHWHDRNRGLTLCLIENGYSSPSGVPRGTALRHPGKTPTALISRGCCNFSLCALKSLALRGLNQALACGCTWFIQ